MYVIPGWITTGFALYTAPMLSEVLLYRTNVRDASEIPLRYTISVTYDTSIKKPYTLLT